MSNSSKFGVQFNGVGSVLQPKFGYKFRVTFYDFGLGADTTQLSQNIESCQRPKFTQPEATVHSYNSQIYLGGKPNWDAITVTVRDDITNASIACIGQQIQRQYNFFEQTSAISGSDYKFRMIIESLDGTHGGSLDVWNLEGCWLTSVDQPEGNYTDATKHSIISMTIRFDNAACLRGDNDQVSLVQGSPFPADAGLLGGGTLGSTLGGFFI